MKRPLAGGSPTMIGANCAKITVDPTGVYCTNALNGEGITRVPLDGGPPVTLATAFVFAMNIAVDETAVYWTDPYDAMVMKVAK